VPAPLTAEYAEAVKKTRNGNFFGELGDLCCEEVFLFD